LSNRLLVGNLLQATKKQNRRVVKTARRFFCFCVRCLPVGHRQFCTFDITQSLNSAQFTHPCESIPNLEAIFRSVEAWIVKPKWKRQSIVAGVLSSTLASILFLPLVGCISIQKSPELPRVTSCGVVSGPEQPLACELHDRREVFQHWTSRMNPAQMVPPSVAAWSRDCKHRTSSWVGNQRDRCRLATSSLGSWIQAKKDEANAPPWPRFHPVPAKPAFEPERNADSDTPEIYGRFGKAP